MLTADYLPNKKPVKVLITSGASCPDALVEGVIKKLIEILNLKISTELLIEQFH